MIKGQAQPTNAGDPMLHQHRISPGFPLSVMAAALLLSWHYAPAFRSHHPIADESSV